MVGLIPASGQSAEPRTPQLLVGVAAEPSSLDPHARGDGASFAAYKYPLESLLWWSPEFELVGSLADTWEFSSDGTDLSVQLREGAMFHDGTLLDATTVKANFDRLLNEDLGLIGTSAFRGTVDSVDAVDDRLVVFHLTNPKPSFTSDLANSYARIMSAPSLLRQAEEIASAPIGTGPYVFEDWTKSQSLRFSRFPEHWDASAGADELIIRPIPDAVARVAALEAGDIHVVESPSFPDVQRLHQDPRFRILNHDSAQAYVYHLNMLKPHFADDRVRHALNYAIDRDAIASQIYAGLAKPLDSPLAPIVAGYASVGHYAFDPEKARQLLAEAGFGEGLDLTLWYPEGRYLNDRQLNEAIAGYLHDVGVELTMVGMENSVFLDRLLAEPSADRPPEYDMALLNAAPGNNDADALWRLMIETTSQPPAFVNTAFYSNDEVDQLVVEARQTVDTQQRYAIHRRIQEIVWGDAPWLFVVSPQQVHLARADLTGERFSPFQLDLQEAALTGQ
jgi:peptide/nickel transport system substrate-binding protein